MSIVTKNKIKIYIIIDIDNVYIRMERGNNKQK